MLLQQGGSFPGGSHGRGAGGRGQGKEVLSPLTARWNFKKQMPVARSRGSLFKGQPKDEAEEGSTKSPAESLGARDAAGWGGGAEVAAGWEKPPLQGHGRKRTG